MRSKGKKLGLGLALVLALSLTLFGCGSSVLLTAQGPTVDAAALQELTSGTVHAEPAEPESQPGPPPADSAEESPALTVDPGLASGGGNTAQALAAWSGLRQLRDALQDRPVRLEVANILQNPELPNGCEITSAAIALNYLGVPADKTVLARDYLPKGEYYRTSDPEQEFMGSPIAGELGAYCMPPPVVTAVNNYLADAGNTGLLAQDISGADAETLKDYLRAGTPVVVWVTQHFAPVRYAYYYTLPDGGKPYNNLHCVVLSGYDDGHYYITDPLAQAYSVDKDTFTEIYTAMGSRALVIVPR